MTSLFTLAAKLVGDKFAKPFTFTVLAGVLLLGVFLLGRCSGDDNEDDYQAQIDQTNRSSDATAQAAQGAIEVLEGRTATEDAIDEAVTEAVNEISGATDAEAVRAAVLAELCTKPSYAADPACQVGETP